MTKLKILEFPQRKEVCFTPICSGVVCYKFTFWQRIKLLFGKKLRISMLNGTWIIK